MSDIERVADHLRSAIGGIHEEVGDLDIAVRWPISVYETSEGSATVHDVLGPQFCTPNHLLDVAGMASTDSDGQAELSLNQFHCLDRGKQLGYHYPINIVATPRSNAPTVLSVWTEVVDDQPQDVRITVQSWNLDGDTEGGIPFYWRCLVPTVDLIN